MMVTVTTFSRERGFSLIEALLAVVILATGLLAIARFQSGLVTSSGASKARAEAIALAQQKIDEIRSYEDFQTFAKNLNPDLAVDASTNYSDIVTDTAVPDDAQEIVGTNSDFTRQWSITANATTRSVDMSVSWTDPRTNQLETVTLSTEVAWADPTLAAQAEEAEDFEPPVPSPTGVAVYGDESRDTDGDQTTLNDDGLTYTHIQNDTDVELLNLDGDVLLRLEDACNRTDGNQLVCSDFVRIKGLVWVDDSTVSSVDITNVSIQASDTAYCAKAYSKVVTTSGSRFRYFPYTCYLGGAWNGNIGITQYESNASSRGDVCVGDPVTSSGAGVDSPKITVRRVYRGMISFDEYDNTDYSTPGADLIVDDADGDGIGKYASAGVADALELPNPGDTGINANYLAGYYNSADASQNLYLPGHNYMITDLPGNDPVDADCLAVMNDAEVLLTLSDGSSNLSVNAFTKTPDDFQCLNYAVESGLDVSGNTVTVPFFNPIDHRVEPGYLEADNDQILMVLTNDGSSNYYYIGQIQPADASGNVSSTNIINQTSGLFMDIAGCPYDPSDPPSEKDFLYGSIYNLDQAPVVVNGTVVNTSDDIALGTAGACTATGVAGAGTAVSGGEPQVEMSEYECEIYHKYTDKGIGWTGNVVVTPASGMTCMNAVVQNDSYEGYSYPDSSSWLTADTGDQTTKNELDFYCITTNDSIIVKGDLIDLDGVTVTDVSMYGVSTYGLVYKNASEVGTCSFTSSDYICMLPAYYANSGVAIKASWTGGTTNPASKVTTVCEYDADINVGAGTIAHSVDVSLHPTETDTNSGTQDAIWIGIFDNIYSYGGLNAPYEGTTDVETYGTYNYRMVPDVYIQDLTFDNLDNCSSVDQAFNTTE